MKNLKKFLLALLIGCTVLIGFTSCDNFNKPEGLDLEDELDSDTSWLEGKWKVTKTMKMDVPALVQSMIGEDLNEDPDIEYIVVSDTLSSADKTVTEFKNKLKKIIEQMDDTSEYTDMFSQIPGLMIKEGPLSWTIVNDKKDRIECGMYVKAGTLTSLLVKIKVTTTMVFEKVE